MKCPKCGFENLDEANFCIKCGSRIDEKIPCPKCGEYVPNDAAHCPNCGKAIPHRSEANIIKNEKSVGVKARISNIFNRVSTYVTLFLLIAIGSLSLASSFSFYSGLTNSNYNDFYSYFITSFNNFEVLNNAGKASLITQLVIISIDVIVTTLFAIVGIRKCVKAFADRDNIIRAYKYLGVLLVTKILTLALLNATCGSYLSVDYSSTLSFLISSTFIHLAACAGLSCYLKFKRGQVSIFVAHVILGFGIYLPMIMISLFGNKGAYVGMSGSGVVGLIYHFYEMSDILSSGAYLDGFISTFVLTSISLIFILVLISTLFYFIVFYFSGYYRGLSQFKKFRIVFYMSTILIAILSSTLLISSVIEFAMLQNYVGFEIFYFGAPVGEVILSIILIGVSVTTFNIYNRASRRASIEEKTTLVE